LFYEIIINFIYAFTLPWIGIKTLIGVVVTSILLMGVAVFYYGSLKIGDSIGGGVYTGGILRVTFSFFCGVLLCRLYRKNVIPRMSVKSPWLILILMAILLVMNPSRDIRPYYDIIAVAFAFPLLVGAALSTEPKQFYRVFTFLGIISYPVYALHAGLGRIALRGMDKLASMGFAIPVPYSGLVLLVCLAVIAYCADRFFDAPVRTFLNKRVLMLGQKNQAMSRKD
jgi:peptidoglycan/LPS O-acetylase OafA/YrhL